MRNHQQCPPEDATIAKLGDATFECESDGGCDWYDATAGAFIATDTLIRYGATFWKPITPEPGYRLLTDEECQGKKPRGLKFCDAVGPWITSNLGQWYDHYTYAVPVKQVVAFACGVAYNSEWHMAKFQTPELRDRAVHDANERER